MSFYPLFRKPPTAYRLVPFWFWNDDMEAEEIISQIKEMAEKGIGGFFICARQGLKTPYLSDEWFRYVAVAVGAAQESGLEVWLYDEYPYPSGMSGGEVTLEYPDARHRQLLHRSITVEGPQALCYDLPWARVLCARAILLEEETEELRWSEVVDLVKFVGSVPAEEIFQSTGLTAYTNKRYFTAQQQKRLSWDVPAGRWMISIFLEKEIEDFKYFGHYVDPCHKEAIQTFIQTTHERYASHFEQDFGKIIKGLFTDEVGLLSHIPWSARLPDFFRGRSGYDLVDNLPMLLYGRGERTAQIRYDFFQSIHQLLSAAYYEAVGSWCEDHRLQFVTEVTSIRMTTQRYSHVPGGDSAHEKVGRSLEWILNRNVYSLRADPKIASSIARQLGSERAMIECFHSVGWSMTLQDAKWMLDRLAAFGINLYIFHAFYYSISGLRKHDAPPSQFLQNPYWEHFRMLADYAGRLGYSMSQGRADVPIAVVHPATTFWARMGNAFHGFKYCGNDVAEERELERLKQDWAYLRNQLLLHQVDYDHLDAELLAEATIEDGQLVIGQACYRVLILPPMTNLEAAAWSQVKAFLCAGGIVIGVGLLPYEHIEQEVNIEAEVLEEFALRDSPAQEYWQELDREEASGIEVVPTQELPWIKGAHAAYFIPCVGGAQRSQASERLLALLQQCVPPVVTLEAVVGDRTSLLMQQRILPDESRLIFIAHQEREEKMVRLHLTKCPIGQRVERLDLVTGEVTFISVEKSDNGWSMPLHFAPYESHLLHLSSHEGALAGEENRVEIQAQQPWMLAIDVQDNWRLTARQDNIVRFGSFHFTPDLDNTGLRSGWHAGDSAQEWPLVETKPFINQCADIADRQTFPLRFKQTFGTPTESALAYPMHCWYQSTFFVEAYPSPCKLMMDEDAIGGIYTVYLNGKQIRVRDFVLDEHYGYRQLACEVQQLLKMGNNHLVVHVEVQRDEDGLRDPLYLRGPFGVLLDAAGRPTIGQVPETGMPQSGILQGYPYYAGTLCFTKEITIETLAEEKAFVLALQGWDQQIHDCVEILVNGHSLGVCCWSPYRWGGDSNILHEGINAVEIRVTNTLSTMLEGTYFDEQKHQIVPVYTVDRERK